MNESTRSALATLRQYVRRRPAAERCDLCSTELAHEHPHLIEPDTRRLLCCCEACAILFSGSTTARYRLLPRRRQFLADFRMTDAQWESLFIPINLAFFFFQSSTGQIAALYPSPAGATECLLPLDAWQALAQENPILRELEPDVEALLVNRIGVAKEYYRVPVDECYRLVGLIRTGWRGLSGGVEVWEAIGKFFTELKERSAHD
jgi:hypothetical protein